MSVGDGVEAEHVRRLIDERVITSSSSEFPGLRRSRGLAEAGLDLGSMIRLIAEGPRYQLNPLRGPKIKTETETGERATKGDIDSARHISTCFSQRKHLDDIHTELTAPKEFYSSIQIPLRTLLISPGGWRR